MFPVATSISTRHRILIAFITIASCATFVHGISAYFPNEAGLLGHDYSLFLPWIVAGWFSQVVNGHFFPTEFTPAFCGGIPLLFNPQSLYYSLPQMLMGPISPVEAMLSSWVIFGLLGGVGMYLLLRKIFAASLPAALLGAVLFLLNGFFTNRMIIGHATYHGVALLPLIALIFFSGLPSDPGRVRRMVGFLVRSAAGGLLLSYLFYAGGTNTILPMMLGILLLVPIIVHRRRWKNGSFSVIFGACFIGLLLCAYKFLPALAFTFNVPRPTALRMTSNVVGLIVFAGLALFVPQALRFFDFEAIAFERVEFEYGIGLVPLVLLVAAIVVAMRRRELHLITLPFGRWRWVVGATVVVMLALPIAINADVLGFRWLILHTPILKHMSVMLRFWFAYIPALCVLSALLLDWLQPHFPARLGWAVALSTATIAQLGFTDMAYYQAQRYDPVPLTKAWEIVRAASPIPVITEFGDPLNLLPQAKRTSSRSDAFWLGLSPFPCYEPMFGFRMETFIAGNMTPGPVMRQNSGRYNLKNPACYVFDKVNNCKPGDEFTIEQTESANAFRSYRPFDYVWPFWQYAATASSLIAGIFCFICFAGGIPYLLITRRKV